MQASLAARPFANSDWLFEPKLDGIRCVAFVRDGKVRLLSRRAMDLTSQYPALVGALSREPAGDLVLDGEIVALDDQGRPSFQLLQQRLNLTNRDDVRRADAAVPVVYYVFDLLYKDGYLLTTMALERRKALLRRAVVKSDQVQVVEHFESDGVAAFEAALRHGIEGVVAKHRDSKYECGRRSKLWLKIKSTQTEDFVVGGFSAGAGNRGGSFGSLLLGYHDRDGRLVYAGHVGSGFDERTLRSLRHKLEELRVSHCPFSPPPPADATVAWVQPSVVVEVKFAKFTKDGSLRAPVFQRVRPDKTPDEVQTPEVLGESEPPFRQEYRQMQRDDIEGILEQLEVPATKTILEIGNHHLSVNNLDKPLWPPSGEHPATTKRDLMIYLAKMSAHLLRHLRDRPLTLVRYPHGVSSGRFFQKHWPDHLPDFVETVHLFSEQAGGDQEYVLCQNLPTLLWLAQLADLELHCSLARVNPEPDGRHLSTGFTGSKEAIGSSLLNYPDFIAFDLDPFIYTGTEPAGAHPTLGREGFSKCCEVALSLKQILDSLRLPSFVKTSGATGLHIYVPVERHIDYQGVRAVAENIAQHLASERPEDVTIEWAVERRTGKIFVDYNQNARGKSLAVAYSPRAEPVPTVATPLEWQELGSVYPSDFTIFTVPDRMKKMDDPWAGILRAKIDVSTLFS